VFENFHADPVGQAHSVAVIPSRRKDAHASTLR
jgi:hypothetical protein